MTNKEAISYIKKYCYGEWCEDEWREAMDTAIKALEAQEQLANNSSELDNNIGDLIRRSATIDAVCKAGCGSGYCGISCDDVKAIEQLPSAQPEIIRCKDCKHWLDIDDGRQKHRMCADVYGDWFCADAERRTDG